MTRFLSILVLAAFSMPVVVHAAGAPPAAEGLVPYEGAPPPVEKPIIDRSTLGPPVLSAIQDDPPPPETLSPDAGDEGVTAGEVPVSAEAPPPSEAPIPLGVESRSDLERRIELAKEWHKIMPVSVRQQIDTAIDQVAQSQPEDSREVFKANMKSVLNYEALEKISIDAMAETYTVAELEAMNEYYSKPEAKSAQPKYSNYANKVFPEITRMLDEAVMRVRTGGTGQ
jgi:hypothetical protein